MYRFIHSKRDGRNKKIMIIILFPFLPYLFILQLSIFCLFYLQCNKTSFHTKMTSPQFLACLFLIANILFLVDASLLLEEQCRTCQCRCEEKCQRESNSYETDDKYESNDRNDLQDEMNAIQANIGPEYEPNDLQDNINTIQANTGTEYEPEPFLNPIPVANSRVPQSCERCARQNFDIMNEYRRSHGLRPIRWSQGLGRSAAEHSKEMYRHLSLYHSNHRGWENVAES